MFAPNLQDQYNFAAEPRTVKARTKYREPQQEEQIQLDASSNIMWDRRVVRGNTYAPAVTTSRETAKQFVTSQSKSAKKSIKPIEANEYEPAHADVSTPRPVDGRKHMEVQTDEYVELLTDKPPEYEKDAQTDFYIDRPVNRLFVPQKTGEDKETQVLEGELFDFDYEVEPVLQVLIGKTLEQGRMEVLEEEEIKVLKEEQKRYDELRYAELTEAQKMEAEEKRRADEMDRRKKQHRIYDEKSITSHKKLVCRVLAKEYFKNVASNSFAILREQGVFQNAFNFELRNTVSPQIYDDIVTLEEGKKSITRALKGLSDLVSEKLRGLHEQSMHEEKEKKRKAQEEKERIIAETQERRKQRAEARKARDEEERIRLLKIKIAETLIGKGEQRQGIFNQILADMDSFGREGNSVGLLGGVIGEILMVLSTLNDLKQLDAEDPLGAVRNIEINQELVQKIVDHVVDHIVKEGKIDIGITGDIEAQLTAIDPELTLENLHTKPDRADEVRDVLRQSVNSTTLNALRENAEQLKLSSEYLQLITDSIINHVLSPEDKARKVRLIKTNLDYSETVRADAIVVLMPNIEENRPFNLNEAKGIKTSKRTRRGSRKDSMNAADEIKMEDTEKIITAAEVELEDTVNVFPLQTEEVRVLVHQRAASVILRREVLLYLGSQFKELDMKEIEVLKRVNEKAEGVEDIVAAKFSKKLPILTYEKN